MHFLLNKGDIIQEGDEFFDFFTGEWRYFVSEVGKDCKEGWFVRRPIRLLDIHQIFQTALALSFDKGVSGFKLTKLEYATPEWVEEDLVYGKIAGQLQSEINKFIELLPYE